MDPDDLEEERRLFYVAMTRAEKKLYLSAAQQRRVWGQPQFNPVARFIEEIPSAYLNHEKAPRCSRFASFAPNPQPRNGGHKKSQAFDDFESEPQSFYDESPSASTSTWREGARVKHAHFGKGIIRGIEGSGEETKITVVFEGQALKKFIAKYAKLEVY